LVLLGAYPVYLRRDTASLAQRGQTGAIVVLISLIIALLLGFLMVASVGEVRRVEKNQMEADTDVTVIELKSSIPSEGGAE